MRTPDHAIFVVSSSRTSFGAHWSVWYKYLPLFAVNKKLEQINKLSAVLRNCVDENMAVSSMCHCPYSRVDLFSLCCKNYPMFFCDSLFSALSDRGHCKAPAVSSLGLTITAKKWTNGHKLNSTKVHKQIYSVRQTLILFKTWSLSKLLSWSHLSR